MYLALNKIQCTQVDRYGYTVVDRSKRSAMYPEKTRVILAVFVQAVNNDQLQVCGVGGQSYGPNS